MICSKKTFHSLSLLGLFLVGACSFQAPNEGGQQGAHAHATWFIGPVQVMESRNVTDSVWGLPIERNYSLKACVRDTTTSTPRIGETIRLVDKRASQSRELDPEGCFYWNETVPYRFLADETFGEKLWSVELSGESHTLHLAFNPWRDGSAGLVDLGHDKDISRLKRLASAVSAEASFRNLPQDAGRESNLLVQSVDPTSWIAPRDTGAVTIQPATLRIAVAAEHQTFEGPKQLSLAQGDIRFRAWLGETLTDGTTRFFGALAHPAKTNLKQGWLEVNAEFALQYSPERSSEKVLYYELVPAEDSAGLQSSFGKVVLSGAAKIPQVLNAATWQEIQKASEVPVALGSPSAPPGSAPSSSALVRVVSYSAESNAAPAADKNWQATHSLTFTVCLEPNFNLYPEATRQLEEASFQARWKRTGETAPFKVADNKKGCLRWEQTVEYPYAGVEQYWPGQLEITSPKAPYENFHAQIDFDVNPWREKKVGWDRALGAAPQNLDPKPPTLILSKYTATNLGTWNYHVDSFLQLTLVRKVLFSLTPELHKPYSFDYGKSYNKSLDSDLEFDVAVSFDRADGKAANEKDKDKYSDPAFLGSFSTSASVEANHSLEAYGAIPIQFVNLLQWTARIQASISISPKGTLGPKRVSKIGLFSGNPVRNEEETRVVFEDQVNAPAANILKGKKSNSPTPKRTVSYPLGAEQPLGTATFIDHEWKGYPLFHFIDYMKRYAPVNYELMASLPAAEVIDHAAAISFARGFCPDAKLFPETSQARLSALDCQKSPLRYLQVGFFRIADTIEAEPTKVDAGDHGTTKIAATFFNEKKFSETEIRGHTFRRSFQAGLRAALGYGKFERGGAPIGSFTVDNQNYSTEEGLFSQDWRNGMRGQSDITLDRKKIKLTLHGHFRNCASVRPLPSSISAWGMPVQVRCGQPAQDSIDEFFYAFTDQGANSSSPLMEGGDLVQRGWQKIIRGEDAFWAWDSLLAQATRGFLLRKIETFHDGIETTLSGAMLNPLSQDRLFLDGGIFPGVSDYVEYSDIKWTDFEIRRQAEAQIAELIAGGVRPAVAARYGYCYVAEIAARVSHGDYKASAQSVAEWDAVVRSEGVERKCQLFAKDPRWDEPPKASQSTQPGPGEKP